MTFELMIVLTTHYQKADDKSVVAVITHVSCEVEWLYEFSNLDRKSATQADIIQNIHLHRLTSAISKWI